MGDMTAAHFIFIPAVLLVGVVIGWILGSRAAGDAFAAELCKREERAARASTRKLQIDAIDDRQSAVGPASAQPPVDSPDSPAGRPPGFAVVRHRQRRECDEA